MAAGIYTVVSALISRLGRSYSVLPPKVILWFFITSDVIATIAQVCGAALIGKRESDRKDPTDANNILLGGLAYQVFAMGVFVIISGIFLSRARHGIRQRRLTLFSIAFAISTVLVFLRTAVRLAETTQGLYGELQTHEVYFACLEFAPIALAVLFFACWFPGRCVGSSVQVRDKKNQIQQSPNQV